MAAPLARPPFQPDGTVETMRADPPETNPAAPTVPTNRPAPTVRDEVELRTATYAALSSTETILAQHLSAIHQRVGEDHSQEAAGPIEATNAGSVPMREAKKDTSVTVAHVP